MRPVAALLLLANLAFLALAQGWLLPLAGLSTHQQREPQRLAAQVNPQRVRIVAAGAAPATRCLQAGPFSAEQADAALAALAAPGDPPSPVGSVQRVPAAEGIDPPQFWLRAEAADPALRAKLQALALPGDGFAPCKP